VILHARNEQRAKEAATAFGDPAAVVVGDLASLEETRRLAADAVAAAQGPLDAVIHNAGIGSSEHLTTGDGLDAIFQVNVVAPYLLTALMPPPGRLVYLTSGLSSRGQLVWDDLQWKRRRWDGSQAYSDSKLHDLLLTFAVARHWPETITNAVDPGWIKTRMGGRGAPGSLADGADTPVWLAVGEEPDATVTGRYLKSRRPLTPNPLAVQPAQQERLLNVLAELTSVSLPTT